MNRKPDIPLLVCTVFLVLIGLLMVFSSTTMESVAAGDPFLYLKKQLMYVIFGFIFLFIGARTDYRKYRSAVGWMLGISFVLLMLVFMPVLGRSAGGASRWIDIGILSFQPSEFLKLAVVIYLADLLTKRGETIGDIVKVILPALTVTGFFCVLVMKQPDLGTVIVIFGTAYLMFFLAGAKPAHLVWIAIASVAVFFAVSVLSPYRAKRLMAFIDPWKDPKGIGFHIIQSLIAIGSGGFFGLGLGCSRQKYLYLPEQYTDFIFAVLCEEAGFIGAVIVIGFFVGLIGRGFKISREAADRFGMLLAGGITSCIALEAVVNIGVVVGLIPTTGIPLPFISYGGTSLVVMMYAVGILLNISSTGSTA
jgi:cell division protein FtsW